MKAIQYCLSGSARWAIPVSLARIAGCTKDSRQSRGCSHHGVCATAVRTERVKGCDSLARYTKETGVICIQPFVLRVPIVRVLRGKLPIRHRNAPLPSYPPPPPARRVCFGNFHWFIAGSAHRPLVSPRIGNLGNGMLDDMSTSRTPIAIDHWFFLSELVFQ